MNRRKILIGFIESCAAVFGFLFFGKLIRAVDPNSADWVPGAGDVISKKNSEIEALNTELRTLRAKYDAIGGNIPQGFKRVSRSVTEGLNNEFRWTLTVYEEME